MKKININYMSDEVVATIKSNPDKYTKLILDNLESNEWLIEEFKTPYVAKKITIPDFEFIVDPKLDNKELSYKNSVLIHQSLKDVPAYVLSDERFWAWINFDKGYFLCQLLMPLKENSSRLKNHYFFGSGSVRRGMFFGIISRLFFRAHLTYEPQNGDPYEITRYVNDNPQRFRNLTWRTYSNNADLVKKILQIQYKFELKYKEKMTTAIFEEIAKYISQIGSLTYVDIITESDLEGLLENKVKKLLQEAEDTYETVS